MNDTNPHPRNAAAALSSSSSTDVDSTADDHLPEPVIDAAITWAVRLNYNIPTEEEKQLFENWHNADPAHARAWHRVHSLKGFQADLGELPPKLAHETLRTVQGHRDQLNRRKVMKLLSLMGVVMASGWIARDHTPWQRLLADASTSTGEQKTLQLDDGSVLVLNTDSAISTDLTGSRRLVILQRGELLINTGTDSGMLARRPFWVYTPFGRIQALGTRFVVRLDGQRARVSVQESAVELHPAKGSAPVIVQAGESHWLMEDGTAPAASQGFDTDSWSEGALVGRNIRLQDLLAELARYRVGHISCDPRVADLRVSGSFMLHDTDSTLRFIEQTQPLQVSFRTRFWVTVGPRD